MVSIVKSLEKDLKKKYENTNPMIVKDSKLLQNLEVFSSGDPIIDAVSGIGGLVPKGHVVELIGANTSGKTTVCLQTCHEAQDKGENVIYIDAEGVLDINYAKTLGVDTDSDSWSLLQPSCGEEVMDIFDTLDVMLVNKKKELKKGESLKKEDTVGLIVIDSVAMTRPLAELQGNRQIGQHASLWAKLAYKIKNLAMMHNIGFILINQVRYAPDIGGPMRGPAGVLDSSQNNDMGSENTTGGETLKFLYSIRWQFKGFAKIEGTKENRLTGEEEVVRIGNKSHVTTIKNKLAPPLVKSQFVIEYGKGTVPHHTLTEIMKARGFIENRGAYKKYECLDPSLQPNMEHPDYPGFIYGASKFDTWFLSDEIQADVLRRFRLLLNAQEKGKISGDNDHGDEHLNAVSPDEIQFEVESAQEKSEKGVDAE